MSDREWVSTNSGRATIALFAVSLFAALWTLVQAIRLEPVVASAAPAFATGSAFVAVVVPPAVDVAAAVATDAFAPDRAAPEQRYRTPGEESDAAPPEALPEPVVLGTAVSDPAHSFATVLLAGSTRSVILHVGDKIGPYIVKSIEQRHVVFRAPSGKTLDIPELKP